MTPSKPGSLGARTRFYLYDNVEKRFVELHDGFLCGRTEGDLQFADDNAVSRRQCQFLITGNDVYVEDLNSTNRTKINSVPTQPGFRRRIQLNDVIEFGSQRLVLSHQNKFPPANIQDRAGQDRVYKAARVDGGRLTSEVSRMLTKATLVLLDKATFRRLRLEEAFVGSNRRRRSTDQPVSRRAAWALMLLMAGVWASGVAWAWQNGALQDGLAHGVGELLMNSAMVCAMAGAVSTAFYVRFFLLKGRGARWGVAAVFAGVALGLSALFAQKSGLVSRVAQNLAVVRCVHGWDSALCRRLWELDQGEWIHLPVELSASLSGRLGGAR